MRIVVPEPLVIEHDCASGMPLVAVDPGDGAWITDLFDIRPLHPRPARGWCMACWPALARPMATQND